MYQSTVPYLVAEAGFEPHDLRVMSPTSYQAAPLRDIGAGNGNRTRTILSYHGILSPGRLPIPPLRRISSALPKYYSIGFTVCQYLLVKNFDFFAFGFFFVGITGAMTTFVLHLFPKYGTIQYMLDW